MFEGLGAVEEHLMTAFALDDVTFCPELRVKFNYYGSEFLGTGVLGCFLASDFVPLFAPFVIMVADFSSHFDTRFDFSNVIVSDFSKTVIAMAVLPEIIAHVIRKVILRYTTIRAGLDDVDDVVLLPLLEIVVTVLIKFLTLDVGGFK